MNYTITEPRNFVSKLVYAGLFIDPITSRAIVKLNKVLFDGDIEIAVEEQVALQISNAGYAASRNKAQERTPGPNNSQGRAPIATAQAAIANAFDNFNRTDAEINTLIETHVLPMYQ